MESSAPYPKVFKTRSKTCIGALEDLNKDEDDDDDIIINNNNNNNNKVGGDMLQTSAHE